jgi:type I restriction enzyme S subunit
MQPDQTPVYRYEVLSDEPLSLLVPDVLADPRRMDVEYYRPRFVQMETRIQQSGLQLEALDKLRNPRRMITDGIRQHVKTKTGVILIRTQNLGEPTLDLSDCVYVDANQHQAASKSAVVAGDLLVAIRGYLGKAALAPSDIPQANINQHIARLSVNPPCADSGYLWAFFTSPTGTTHLERQVTGTVQQGVMLPSVRSLPIPLPPRPVQNYIGAKVRLAEWCRLRAQELWSTSERILAEAIGVPLGREHYEQISEVELRTTHYQLVSTTPVAVWLDSSMVEHQLGPQYFHPRRTNAILKLQASGVELKRLVELAERKAERIASTGMSGAPSIYVGLAEIDSAMGYFDPVPTSQAEITGTSTLFKSGDILFSKLRPYLNKVGICPPHIEGGCGSTELLVYRTRKGGLSYYVFFVLRSNAVLFQIIDTTTGSTLPRVDPETVDDILVPMISHEQQVAIDRNVRHALDLRYQAAQLVKDAKSDVEALIEGRLDVGGIVAGRVKPPTWDEIGA